MTIIKCLYCKHVWSLNSYAPIIGGNLDEITLNTPCPSCGLIRDLLYVGTDIVAMRTKFAPEDLEVIKNAMDFTINKLQSSGGKVNE